MIEIGKHIDEYLFQKINTTYTNVFFDIIFPLIRNPLTWIPLYIFLAVWMSVRFKKKGLVWVLIFGATVAYSDFLSAQLLKSIFERVRPCNDATLSFYIRELIHCGSGYSMPSAHACNHFAMAFFLSITLCKKYAWITYVAILWAACIAYAQVYVGVHYPSDVVVGALLGSIIGWSVGKFYNAIFSL